MMNNFLEPINVQLDKLEKSVTKVKSGTVTAISPFTVQFDGESTTATYLKPKNYTPVVNDRVYFLFANGKYVCLGAYE